MSLGVGQIQWCRKKGEHAHEAAKEVYVIWMAEQTPSVFVTQTATEMFGSAADAVEFFKARLSGEKQEQ